MAWTPGGVADSKGAHVTRTGGALGTSIPNARNGVAYPLIAPTREV